MDMLALLHSAVQLLFLCVHGAIIVCVCEQIRKKNRTFRSTFFLIYLMESVVDIVYVIWMNLFLGMLRMGLLVDFYSIFPIGNASFFIIAYGKGFQMVAHAATAVNRYAVLSRHAVTTHSTSQVRIALLLLLLPLPSALIRTSCRVIVVEVAPGTFNTAYAQPWAYPVSTTCVFLYGIVTAVVSFVLDMRTLCLYRRLTTEKRRKYRQEFLLLVYALLQFAIHLTWLALMTLFLVASYTHNLQLLAVVQSSTKYVIDAVCFSGPILLFTTSSALRKSLYDTYLGKQEGMSTVHVSPNV